jgi:hypothetical protein
MKFFVEQHVVFFHFVKYFGKDSTNISRVILSGPYYPVAHFAPVSPTCLLQIRKVERGQEMQKVPKIITLL